MTFLKNTNQSPIGKRIAKEFNMSKCKSKTRRINKVKIEYVGTDEQFVKFLRSIVKDYIDENKLTPSEKELIFSG